MLFKQAFLDGIADGKVTLAFRCWRKPTVKAGGRLRTAVGELAIKSVDIIAERDITPQAAKRAGYDSREALLQAIHSCDREGKLYRIAFKLAGPDARIVLRQQAAISDAVFDELQKKLARFDAASKVGPWTLAVLRLIADHPETKAGDLASIGGFDKEWLKLNIRKLKELGLTESLSTGYRLSPRGDAFLERVER